MPKFPCTTCGAEFPTEEALLAHVGEYHKNSMMGWGTENLPREKTIEFPEAVKEFAAKEYMEWEQTKDLGEEAKKSKFSRAVRVSARYLPGLRKELRSGDLTWFSDAAKAVGGLGEHPGALQHFIAGLPLCQMTHYSERASVWGVKIEDLEVSAIGRYIGIAGHGFDTIEYEVKIASPEPKDKIRELARAAAGDCYVTNTLKHSCKVAGKVILNGESLMDL